MEFRQLKALCPRHIAPEQFQNAPAAGLPGVAEPSDNAVQTYTASLRW